jgi:hypothetical protein
MPMDLGSQPLGWTISSELLPGAIRRGQVKGVSRCEPWGQKHLKQWGFQQQKWLWVLFVWGGITDFGHLLHETMKP